MYDKVEAVMKSHAPKAMPEPDSTISMAVNGLASSIGEAEKCFELLADRLAPIMATQNEVCSGSPSPQPNCELEDRIINLGCRVNGLIAYINSTKQRLCI